MKFTKLHAVRFVKEKLEFEGMECFLTDEGFDSASPEALPGWTLKVRANDVEQTVKILIQVSKEYDFDKIQENDTIKDLKKILVPLDVVDYSLNTCQFVFELAETMHAEIKFLYVPDDPDLSGPTKYTTSWEEHEKIARDEAYEKAQRRLLKFSDVIKKQISSQQLKKVKFHFAMYAGNIGNTIVDISQRYDPDLIIIEQKAKTPKEREHLAKITHYVIDHTKFPVLTIPENAVFQKPDRIKILHLTDLNESDFNVLNKLLETVKPFETKIYCIHFNLEYNPVPQDKVDWINQFLKGKYTKHEIQADLLKGSDFSLDVEEFIEKNQIDWISLLSPRRNFLDKIFHPDILNKMIRTSKVPILIFQAQ